VVTLLEIQGDDNKEGWYLGGFPLTWAARNRHEEVVEMLVGWEEVGPDEANIQRQTRFPSGVPFGMMEC